MAEPTPAPVLPSTADAVPYVPVSWMAVASIAVASLFIAILLFLGLSGFLAKKPVIQPELLALPAIGVVLSFAARRVIRNAEGTRTGEGLANSAWWICVVAGLGFAAYLLAIDYAIRRDAKNELERWINDVKASDEVSLNRAFLRTRDPGQRSGISPEDTAQIQARFGDDYASFQQCDLVQTARRNSDDFQFIGGAVKEWNTRGGGIECLYSGTLKCREGTFPVVVAMRGVESTSTEVAGRQWWVLFTPQGGYFARDRQKRTPYGWMVTALEETGNIFGNQFIASLRGGSWAVPYAYQAMIVPDPKPSIRFWVDAGPSTPARVGALGGLGAARPYTPDFLKYSFRDTFYKAPGGATPSEQQRKEFMTAWEAAGLLPARSRLRNSPEPRPLLTVTPTRVEVRIPCEIPLPGPDVTSAARARLVVSTSDPGLLAELRERRNRAETDPETPTPGADVIQRDYKWRVIGVESDMIRQSMPRPSEMPGGMPAEPPSPKPIP